MCSCSVGSLVEQQCCVQMSSEPESILSLEPRVPKRRPGRKQAWALHTRRRDA